MPVSTIYKNYSQQWSAVGTVGPFTMDQDVPPGQVNVISCHAKDVMNMKGSTMVRFEPRQLRYTADNATESRSMVILLHSSFPPEIKLPRTQCQVHNYSLTDLPPTYYDNMTSNTNTNNTAAAQPAVIAEDDPDWLIISHYVPPLPPNFQFKTKGDKYAWKCYPTARGIKVVPPVIVLDEANYTNPTYLMSLHVHKDFPDDQPIPQPDCQFAILSNGGGGSQSGRQQQQSKKSRQSSSFPPQQNRQARSSTSESTQVPAWWINLLALLIMIASTLYLFYKPKQKKEPPNNKNRKATTSTFSSTTKQSSKKLKRQHGRKNKFSGNNNNCNNKSTHLYNSSSGNRKGKKPFKKNAAGVVVGSPETTGSAEREICLSDYLIKDDDDADEEELGEEDDNVELPRNNGTPREIVVSSGSSATSDYTTEESGWTVVGGEDAAASEKMIAAATEEAVTAAKGTTTTTTATATATIDNEQVQGNEQEPQQEHSSSDCTISNSSKARDPPTTKGNDGPRDVETAEEEGKDQVEAPRSKDNEETESDKATSSLSSSSDQLLAQQNPPAAENAASAIIRADPPTNDRGGKTDDTGAHDQEAPATEEEEDDDDDVKELDQNNTSNSKSDPPTGKSFDNDVEHTKSVLSSSPHGSNKADPPGTLHDHTSNLNRCGDDGIELQQQDLDKVEPTCDDDDTKAQCQTHCSSDDNDRKKSTACPTTKVEHQELDKLLTECARPSLMAETTYEFVLYVDGMTCGGCEGVVHNALANLKDVKSVVVSWKDASATIQSSVPRLDLLAVAQAIDDVGFGIFMGPTPSLKAAPAIAKTETSLSETSSAMISPPSQVPAPPGLPSPQRESSLSLMDELRIGSVPIRRYRCRCGAAECICSSHPVHSGDPGREISLSDLCERIESNLTSGGGSLFGAISKPEPGRLEDWIQSSNGGSGEFREQLASMPIPCTCAKSHGEHHDGDGDDQS